VFDRRCVFFPWEKCVSITAYVTFFTAPHGVGTLGRPSKFAATVQDCQERQTESD
jgi:hypothetical protein